MRVFQCGECGHRMRFGGERCNRCYAEKPLLKSPPFYTFVGYLALLGLSLSLVVMAFRHMA